MKQFILSIGTLLLGWSIAAAQAPQSAGPKPDDSLHAGLNMNNLQSLFEVEANEMNSETREKLNQTAGKYRSTRGIIRDVGNAMLAGGTAAVINVVTNEIINLTQVRSKQKKAWRAMRQKECTFVDSLQSLYGQSDFYSQPSTYGPLDPSDMKFDGITIRANRDGKDVLMMVCHIDTTRLDHLFLHSKFYMVVDSIVFHPYRAFLPNLTANRIERPLLKTDYAVSRRKAASEAHPGGQQPQTAASTHDKRQAKADKKCYWAKQETLDYWETIRQFDFSVYQQPTVNIRIDLSSSWVNELVQVYRDIKLGTFTASIPIDAMSVTDSVYVYSRSNALATGQKPINMDGDCFVVPRSYMPGQANNPSWGTGEYKMKVVLTENCRYNPQDGRSRHWHRDYKQLVRMQNHGAARNEYMADIVTTFRDNTNTILKATYSPVFTTVTERIGISGTNKGGGAGAGAATGGAKANPAAQPGGGPGPQ